MLNKMCVIGLGYIGLPTSAVFAENGWEVTGVDINELIVDSLNKGKVIIKENGLESVVEKTVSSGNLLASLSPTEADVFMIAVPTPHDTDLTANLEYVKDAVISILSVLK